MGVLFYCLARRHSHVYFLPDWLSLSQSSLSLFGAFGDQIPTFIHVYAFILLTVVIAAASIARLTFICLAWLALDSLLEVAQMDAPAHWIAAHTPEWFSRIPFLENTANYFLLGTFDPLDLASIATGSLAAYLTVHILQGRLHDEQRP
jgi:hypothetical protein